MTRFSGMPEAHLDGAGAVAGGHGHAYGVALQAQHSLADDVARVARAGRDHDVACGAHDRRRINRVPAASRN